MIDLPPDLVIPLPHPDVLREWDWLLQGRDLTPIAMSRFGDWFLSSSDGVVLFLDATGGELTAVAKSVAEFERLVSVPDNADNWLLAGVVHNVLGKRLGTGSATGGEFTLLWAER